jgi:hypothetical protein
VPWGPARRAEGDETPDRSLRHIVSEVSAQIALDTPSPTATSPQRTAGVV